MTTATPKPFRRVRKELAEKMADQPEVIERDALDSAGRRIWCAADGCPCRASVLFAAALCSWHDVAKREDWPRVTAELLDLQARGVKPQRPAIKRAPWVEEAARKLREHRSGVPAATATSGPIADLARSLEARNRQREVPHELDDDAVNALLQEAA